ncbi:MAG: fructose-6-phosphate aldolase [Coriobacteriales bacterium]|nr:fructose-6-phosphate aldolase [Coriobacteriales bacterium]
MQFFLDTASLDEIAEAVSWGALSGVTTNPSLYARVGSRQANFHEHIRRICALVSGPVSAEVTARETDQMVVQARELAALAANVVVKIPLTLEGLAATRRLSDSGIAVNMTLCFSVPQALLAARAGARYVSPFVGRFDDIGDDGTKQLATIVNALRNYDFNNRNDSGVAGGAVTWLRDDDELKASAPDDPLPNRNSPAQSGCVSDGADHPFAKRSADFGACASSRGIEVIAASIRNPGHVTQAALVGADIATVPFAVLKKCAQHPLTVNGLLAFEKDWEKVKNA